MFLTHSNQPNIVAHALTCVSNIGAATAIVAGDFVMGDSVARDFVVGDSVAGDFVMGDSVSGDFVMGHFVIPNFWDL